MVFPAYRPQHRHEIRPIFASVMKPSYTIQEIPRSRIATFDTAAVAMMRHNVSAMLEFDNMFAVNFYQSTDEIIKEALSKHKGVCQHFAELYSAIANQSGIKTYVISGYTKQNGSVDYLPHAWCASLIDSTWYLIDPTNEGINHLNRFIDFRNRQFTPGKQETEIREMVHNAERSLLNARLILKEINDPDSNTAASILQLSRSIDEAMMNLNEQKLFVDKYFKTGKMFRKTLFYKYTWMGIPLN